MKIEEAKKKWCPMLRFVIGPNDSNWQGVAYTNRMEELKTQSSVSCITDDCMFWVEDDSIDGNYGHCGLVKS